MSYPWYEILSINNDDLQQGDFIPNCPILIPPINLNESETEIEIKEIDSIVLSQSCDLVNGKIEIVLVCPYYSLLKFVENLPEEQQGTKARRKVIDNLRKGHLPGYHLLNNDNNINALSDYQVVDFRNVYGVHFNSLVHIISDLKESQAFAALSRAFITGFR